MKDFVTFHLNFCNLFAHMFIEILLIQMQNNTWNNLLKLIILNLFDSFQHIWRCNFFSDSISDNIPIGIWSLKRSERDDNICELRSERHVASHKKYKVIMKQ